MNSTNTGKWQKYRSLQQDYTLVKHLPETALLSEQSLYIFLDRHRKVILKPDSGAGGAGILVASATSRGCYELRKQRRKKTFASKRELFDHLRRTINVSRYIIQQFVPFARVNGRLFDLRIMVQRDDNYAWVVTGGLAKVAYRGYAVTNPEEYVQPIKHVLRDASLPSRSIPELLEEIDGICLRAAEQLEATFPDLTIIGFDIGLDEQGHVWIIEPNFEPAVYWFKQLPERRTYQKIITFKRKRGKANSAADREKIDEYYYYYYYD